MMRTTRADRPIAVRVPKDVERKLMQDVKTHRLNMSDIVRRILLRHYGLLDGKGG